MITNKEKWIVGILLVLLIGVSLFAFGAFKGKDKPALVPGAQLPAHCNPLRPGYDKNGYPDPFCGEAGTPYYSPCDLNKPGYDQNGFPNANCGFGG